MKHLAGEEYGYLGEVFGRRAPEELACVSDGTLWESGDMWATPEESSDYIKDFYRRACVHADETIRFLDLDSVGTVPWWGPAAPSTTLGEILLLMISETHRHGGHVDVVRELIDGSDCWSGCWVPRNHRRSLATRIHGSLGSGSTCWSRTLEQQLTPPDARLTILCGHLIMR